MRLLLIFLGIFVPIFGKSYIGDTHLSNQKTDKITIFGCANLDNIVAKHIFITGPLSASNITADYFTVAGPVIVKKGLIQKSIITGNVVFSDVKGDNVNIIGSLSTDRLIVVESFEIIGTLNAKNSQFIKMILEMNESSMKDSKANELIVRQTNPKGKPQKLKLYGDTHINTIIFESGQGEVHVYGSNVKLSKVTGAKVIQH